MLLFLRHHVEKLEKGIDEQEQQEEVFPGVVAFPGPSALDLILRYVDEGRATIERQLSRAILTLFTLQSSKPRKNRITKRTQEVLDVQ